MKMAFTDKTKVNISKTALLGSIALFIVFGYGMVRYAQYRVKKNLLDMLAPIASQCTTNAGCPLVPFGWVERDCPRWPVLPQVNVCASPPNSSTYKTLVYKANASEFFVHWSYVSDAYLEIHGGRGMDMNLQEFSTDAPNLAK